MTTEMLNLIDEIKAKVAAATDGEITLSELNDGDGKTVLFHSVGNIFSIIVRLNEDTVSCETFNGASVSSDPIDYFDIEYGELTNEQLVTINDLIS